MHYRPEARSNHARFYPIWGSGRLLDTAALPGRKRATYADVLAASRDKIAEVLDAPCTCSRAPPCRRGERRIRSAPHPVAQKPRPLDLDMGVKIPYS